MAKFRLLRERLSEEGTLDPRDVREPRRAAWRELRRVHSRAYVRAIASGGLSADAQRRLGFPWSPAMVERARRSVGATLLAARAALAEGVGVNLAGGTHHAHADRGEGYCVFNDVVVAARVLLREGAIRRAAVVDCDVHQGDGTAAIFAGDPAVFTFSIHAADNFPARNEPGDLDVALADGTGDAAYLTALEDGLAAVLETRPELVFYVAGADPYEGDRWGRLRLTIEGLRRRDARVLDACRAASAPLAVTMGGGYAPDVDAIVAIHANTVREARRSWSEWRRAGARSRSERRRAGSAART
jgi:acetoin utilization deacetylase AcuC-like enzyme